MNRKLISVLACGLLVHTALCGCAAKPQDKAVAEIRKLGGAAIFDEKSPGKPVICVMFSATKAFDSGLEHLKELTQLTALDLSHTLVSDAGLEHLRGLTELQGLHLDDTKVTDAGLEQLKGWKQLQRLNLDGTQVTDAGLEHLKGWTQLKLLYLRRTKVTGAGAQDLQKALPNVEIIR